MSRNCWSCFISPLPIVPATAVPNRNAAAKLKNAAQITACPGERTRVETTVAIELAASWNPLRKSKNSAIAMMKITSDSGGGAEAAQTVRWLAAAKIGRLGGGVMRSVGLRCND